MNLGSSLCFADAWLGLISLFALTTLCVEWRVIKSTRRISSKIISLF